MEHWITSGRDSCYDSNSLTRKVTWHYSEGDPLILKMMKSWFSHTSSSLEVSLPDPQFCTFSPIYMRVCVCVYVFYIGLFNTWVQSIFFLMLRAGCNVRPFWTALMGGNCLVQTCFSFGIISGGNSELLLSNNCSFFERFLALCRSYRCWVPATATASSKQQVVGGVFCLINSMKYSYFLVHVVCSWFTCRVFRQPIDNYYITNWCVPRFHF